MLSRAPHRAEISDQPPRLNQHHKMGNRLCRMTAAEGKVSTGFPPGGWLHPPPAPSPAETAPTLATPAWSEQTGVQRVCNRSAAYSAQPPCVSPPAPVLPRQPRRPSGSPQRRAPGGQQHTAPGEGGVLAGGGGRRGGVTCLPTWK